jgi:hypothetical protein
VVRFGEQVDTQGVLAGSPQAEKLIGYAVKFLVKDLGDDLNPLPNDHRDDNGDELGDDGQDENEGRPAPADLKAAAARRVDHIARLVEALRYAPCSPKCPDWLRYVIQPKHPRPGLVPGCCRAKAQKPTHLGYGGRRVLVSRKWTGKDLADHRYDRRAYVLAVLGRDPDANPLDTSATDPAPRPDPSHVVWEKAKNSDDDVDPLPRRTSR